MSCWSENRGRLPVAAAAFAAAAQVALLTGAAQAADATPPQPAGSAVVKLLGPTSVDITRREPGTDATPVSFSLLWTGTAPGRIVTTAVTRDGQAVVGLDSCITWQVGTLLDGILEAKGSVAAACLDGAGIFTVTAEALVPVAGQAPAIRPFTVSLQQRASSVQVPQRLRVTDGTAKLTITETGGKSALFPLTVQPIGELKTSTAASANATIVPRGPAGIAAGSTVTVELASSETLPYGSVTGTVLVNGPQLAAPATVEVEYLTRSSLCWLALVLVLSIALGYAVRVFLTRRQEADKAHLKIAEANADLIRQAAAQADPVVRQQILDIGRDLMEINPNDADAGAGAITRAQQNLQSVLTSANSQRNDVRNRLKRLKDMLLPAEGMDPALVRRLAPAIERVQEIDLLVQAGQIVAPGAELGDLEGGLAVLVAAPLDDWLDDLYRAVTVLTPWQAHAAVAAVTAVSAEVEQARGLTDPVALISAVNSLAKRLRRIVGGKAAVGVDTLVDNLATLLTSARRDDITGGIKALMDGLAAGGTTDPIEWLGSLRSSLTRTRDLLIQVKPANDAPIRQAFQEADITQLAALLAPQPSGMRSGGATPTPEAGVRFESAMVFEESLRLDGSPPLRRRLSIDCPLRVAAGASFHARFVAVPPLSNGEKVLWTLDDALSGDTLDPGAPYVGKAERAGLLHITARLIGTGGELPVFVGRTLIVGSPREAAGVKPLQARLARWDVIGSVVSGLAGVGIGMMIFRNSWIGLAEDWVAAGLWGFSIDLSLAKLREYATPLLSRTPQGGLFTSPAGTTTRTGGQ